MVFLLIFGASLPAWSCSCLGWPSAKQAWQDTPVVFQGMVEYTNPSYGPDIKDEEQIAHARVEVPFKNSSKGQKFILKHPKGLCERKFKTGDRILFYLHQSSSPDLWNVQMCHRTREVEDASDDLLFLRGLPATARGNRLSGELKLYEREPNQSSRTRSLPGVKVTATPKIGKPFSTVTDANGVYQWYGLPAGEYRISIEVPKGMRADFLRVEGAGHLGLLEPKKESVVQLGKESGISVNYALSVAK